jgi:Cof subfamily protein (haloacid dehalogenase superfamily)
VRAAGIRVIVATGRMFRSVKPYLELAGIPDPVVCYQGAAVVDPQTSVFLLHRPIPLELGRRAIEALQDAGYPPNCYVDDELVVASRTPYSDAYANFQHLPVHEVGNLLAWLEVAPTKLVAVGEPHELDDLRRDLGELFGDSLYVTTSLPYLLELGNPAVSKGTGLAFVAERQGFSLEQTVAFGDGENDIELIERAGFGVAVEDAHPQLLERAAWVCPGPDEEGVAAVLEAFLELLPG